MAFNKDKYKKIFESRYGTGSFEAGLSSAREIGLSKAQAEFEKDEYKRRMSEAKKAFEKAQKEAEKIEKESLKQEAKNAAREEAYKRAPDLSSNQYYNKMNKAFSWEGQKRMEEDREKRTVKASDLAEDIKKEKKSKKKNKKKEKGILSDIKDAGKNFGEFINPFDDVSMKEAITKETKREKSKSSKEVNRFASRTINSASLGALEKGIRGKTDRFDDREFGEGGGIDFVSSGLGYLLPGTGAVKGAKALGLGAKGLKGASTTKKAVQLAKEGSAAGALFGLAEGGATEVFSPEKRSIKDHALQIGLETAGGALLDPLLTLGGKKLLNKLGNKLPNKNKNVPTTTQEQTNNNVLANTLSSNNQKATSEKLYENISPETDPGLIKVKPMPDIDHSSGDLASFRSKVDRTPKKDNKTMEFLKNLRTQFVDDMAPLERLEKDVRGSLPSAENSLYKTARLLKGSPERAHELVRTKLAPVLESAKRAGYDEKDLGDYALAVHAKDVNSKGMNSGFTNAEIDDVIKRFGTPEMEAIRKELMKVSDDVLRNELGGNQILSSESIETMREKWPNYMPLFRSFDDEKVGFAGGMSNALANASNPIKRLEGSSRDVIDPIESMVKNIFQATNQADRNKVGLQLSKLASEDEKGMLRKLASNEKVDRKNVVSVMENGQKVKYEVPPEIYRTITNMDKESTNTLIKILQAPASTLRAGATLTPEFSLRNPLRDVAQAYVVSSSGFNPIIDFPVGLWNAIFKGKTFKVGGKEISTGTWYNDFIESNGGYGNIVSMDRNLHRKALENALKEGDTPKFRNIVNPKSWVELLRTIADVSETATKIGEYRAAINKAGVSREEAAYRARDLMDFARSGTSIREANKVVAFLNANIQGKSKLIRAIKEDPKGVTARAFKAVTAPTIGIYILQKNVANEEQKATIDDAPQWLKDTFWLVPVPGTNQVARVPKPFDLAPIFANLPERTLDYWIDKDPEAFDKFAKEAISSYSVPTMLTGIAPFIEGMANYSFFKQGAIDPMRDQDVQYPDRYDINTSQVARIAGKGINNLTGGEGAFKNFGSPRIIDNTIRGLTGGLGEYTVDAVDMVLEKSGIVSKESEKPDKQINQQPILRSFMVNKGSTGESVNKLYNMLDSLSKARSSAKQNEKDFELEERYKEVKDVTKEISDISKEMRSIENSKELSGSKKRMLLDQLNQQRNEVARQAAKNLK
ncbi:LPD38 domain-containing protein [Fictibacillus sp. JL2B1089]|uniref:LPD38 domain-containing protein n=1 Tax=Fictibacillus sp. JL2B1089 TaxID=3399565 RepID=UPI003A83F24A